MSTLIEMGFFFYKERKGYQTVFEKLPPSKKGARFDISDLLQ